MQLLTRMKTLKIWRLTLRAIKIWFSISAWKIPFDTSSWVSLVWGCLLNDYRTNENKTGHWRTSPTSRTPLRYSDINVLDISTAQVASSKSFHSKAEKGTGDTGRQKFNIALRLPDRSIRCSVQHIAARICHVPDSQESTSDSGSRADSEGFAMHLNTEISIQ